MAMTFSDAKPYLAKVLGFNSTDSRIKDYANSAIERMLYEGHFVGTVVRYRICVNNACITWPRQIETIEGVAVCDCPGTVRDSWYEFNGGGPGIVDENSNIGRSLVDRGTAVAFDDIIGTNKKLRVYADVAEAAGQYITLQGYDEAANWIRTLDGGVWIDGERVLISTVPQLTTKFFTTLTAVLKPVTNGVVRVYEYNTDTAAQKALAYYEPDETRPIYRRSLIPAVTGVSSGSCEKATVEVAVKLRFIKIQTDNDWMMVSHLDALKLAVKAVQLEENNQFADAMNYWYGFVDPVSKGRRGGVFDLLQKQLMHYRGTGPKLTLQVDSRDIYGGAVQNVIGGTYFP